MAMMTKDLNFVNSVETSISSIDEKVKNEVKAQGEVNKLIYRDLLAIEDCLKQQGEINECVSDKLEDIDKKLSGDEDLFATFVNLYQTNERIDREEINSLKEKCKKYKRNTFIAFITGGIIDIILCVMFIMQIYT